MSKRKISQQQQRRIANKQASSEQAVDNLLGLVLAHHGKNLEVEASDGTIVMCNKRQHLGPIVPGDQVTWQMDSSNSGVVTAILPRHSLLTRPSARGDLHAVAANVDQMCVIFAPTPAPNLTTIDRYLISAQQQNIQPLLILNKEDLLSTAPEQNELLQLIEIYRQIGIPTLMLSAKSQQHIPALQEAMAGKTSVFVGQSGVGKSSLIAALLPDIEIKTGELSTMAQQGKHTTTNARLYHLPNVNGNLIDSPGMREFPLWQLEAASLAQGFIEFRPFLHDCKFRNCTHNNEPGCALLAAAAAGKISTARLTSYQKILASMKNSDY